MTTFERFAAFADPELPEGAPTGNPAGLVRDAAGLSEAEMLAVAQEIGDPETVFVTGEVDGDPVVRYFSPAAEVPFCGHATLALAVALAAQEGPGPRTVRTPVGPIELVTRRTPDGGLSASFTSAEPVVSEVPESALTALLELLGLGPEDLAEGFPARISHAGNPHPVLVIAREDLFHQFRFDPAALARLMRAEGWTGTVTVLHRTGDLRYEARNLFPVGRISEDPATGSAAASTGAYLRELGRVRAGDRVRIDQGRHVGRPGVLLVDVPAEGGITVTGTAAPIGPSAAP